MNRCITVFLLLIPICSLAQKKPLDHSVYDGWQSIGERLISHDGKWLVYSITPQEGDAELFIQAAGGSAYKKQIPRGYNAVITEDSRFVIFKIKPYFKDTREARIKKKKPEDFPKDSIGILELGTDALIKVPRIKSFKTPQKAGGWLAWHKEKDPVASRPSPATQKTVDSLKKTVDSLTLLLLEARQAKGNLKDAVTAEEDPATTASQEGSDLVLRQLAGGKEKVFKNVADYYFNAYGQKLLLKVSKAAKDGANAVLLYDLVNGTLDTLLKGGNDFRQFALSEDGSRLAFLAERDTSRSQQKYYGLYLYRNGDDSAALLLDKHSVGMELGMTISENSTVQFSKSGQRLLFGTAPLAPAKDTTLVDIDLVKLDIWHYNDDYLQTQQLVRLATESKRSYMALYDFSADRFVQLATPGLPLVVPTLEGDGKWFVAVTDTGRRIEGQWAGRVKTDVYAVDALSGKVKLVKKNHLGTYYPSVTGRYILLYDLKARHYYSWDGHSLQNLTATIKVPLYNEENDLPDEPAPYGIMGWHEGDSSVYIYDRYDTWRLDLHSKKAQQLTKGRPSATSYRYIRLDPEEKFIRHNQLLYFRTLNNTSKNSGIAALSNTHAMYTTPQAFIKQDAYNYTTFLKARNSEAFLYSRESFINPPDLYFANAVAANAVQITQLNPQQQAYNWGRSELFKWKAFDGKPATGILYKPENFDASKRYPVLIYFYEKMSDNLNRYMSPAPSASIINIPFFVSRGYLVFVPDISYTKGHPGKAAYNYIVSGSQALARNQWVDANNMGIQGQSWGGYQVAYLITATNMYKAAWAGAPVANMFSAYGGIRWGTGLNRQFQYERGQSRIGATPWERPDLYIENSPFFHLNKVKTPLVIMANDADDAVPWYQGIELFTALRRQGKKVWLLNYNAELHNLVDRKNRKDISIRLQQYFDWLLKGEKPAQWITEGVPAVKKGRDWGLQIID